MRVEAVIQSKHMAISSHLLGEQQPNIDIIKNHTIIASGSPTDADIQFYLNKLLCLSGNSNVMARQDLQRSNRK